MPDYIELSITIVNKKHLELYQESQTIAAENLQKHGALAYRIYVSKDDDTTWIDLFPDLKKQHATHVAVYIWTTYKSLKHRKEIAAAILSDKERPVFNQKIDATSVWLGDYKTFMK